MNLLRSQGWYKPRTLKKNKRVLTTKPNYKGGLKYDSNTIANTTLGALEFKN